MFSYRKFLLFEWQQKVGFKTVIFPNGITEFDVTDYGECMASIFDYQKLITRVLPFHS